MGGGVGGEEARADFEIGGQGLYVGDGGGRVLKQAEGVLCFWYVYVRRDG